MKYACGKCEHMFEVHLLVEVPGKAMICRQCAIEKAYEREAERIEKEYAARTGWR